MLACLAIRNVGYGHTRICQVSSEKCVARVSLDQATEYEDHRFLKSVKGLHRLTRDIGECTCP